MKKTSGDLPVGLAAPALRALEAAGIQSLEQMRECSEAGLRRMHGIGPKAIEQLRTALAERGWHFAPDEKKS